MLDDTGRNLVLDISDVKEELPCFEIIQKSNEALFVPSGWIHQVENLEDTISVNHNWINEYVRQKKDIIFFTFDFVFLESTYSL